MSRLGRVGPCRRNFQSLPVRQLSQWTSTCVWFRGEVAGVARSRFGLPFSLRYGVTDKLEPDFSCFEYNLKVARKFPIDREFKFINAQNFQCFSVSMIKCWKFVYKQSSRLTQTSNATVILVWLAGERWMVALRLAGPPVRGRGADRDFGPFYYYWWVARLPGQCRRRARATGLSRGPHSLADQPLAAGGGK